VVRPHFTILGADQTTRHIATTLFVVIRIKVSGAHFALPNTHLVNSTSSTVPHTWDPPPDDMEDFSDEKQGQANHQSRDGSSSHELSNEQPAIDESKLVMKIDLRILPILCLVYLMAFIDRYVAIMLTLE
jgi:hypothetical protein